MKYEIDVGVPWLWKSTSLFKWYLENTDEKYFDHSACSLGQQEFEMGNAHLLDKFNINSFLN